VWIKLNLAVKLFAACHALHLALLVFKLRDLTDFGKLFVHLPVFFNVWWNLDTFPVIFNPFFYFWEVNELWWIAFAIRRVIIRLDVIETTRKLDFYFTFFMDRSIFWVRRTSSWNARFLEVSWEGRHSFLKNLFTILLIVPVTALAGWNLYKYLSRLLIIQRSWILWSVNKILLIFGPRSFRFQGMTRKCLFIIIDWGCFMCSLVAWLLNEWGCLLVYWYDWGYWDDWFQCNEWYLFYHICFMWLFCD